jgi:hypothetical protein
MVSDFVLLPLRSSSGVTAVQYSPPRFLDVVESVLAFQIEPNKPAMYPETDLTFAWLVTPYNRTSDFKWTCADQRGESFSNLSLKVDGSRPI